MSNPLTRRGFLAQGAVLACASLAPCVPGVAAAPAGNLVASRFSSQIDRVFAARPLSLPNAAALALRLRSVEPLRHPAPTSRAEFERSFVLVLDAGELGTAQGAAQDTYEIANSAVGAFAALLVPGRNRALLTAVFNRTV